MRPSTRHLTVWLLAIILLVFQSGCARKRPPVIQKTNLSSIGEPETSSEMSRTSRSADLKETPDEEGGMESPSASKSKPMRFGSAPMPSSGLFQNAAGSISQDLAQEQEDFFLKHPRETRDHYRGPDGELLIPQQTMNKIDEMMGSRFPVKLLLSCESMSFLVPQQSGGGERSSSRLDVLGQMVEAKVAYSDRASSPSVDVKVLYHYTVDLAERSALTAERTIRYLGQGKGKWIRTSVDERILAEPAAEAAPKPKAAAKTKSKIRPKAAAASEPKPTAKPKSKKSPESKPSAATKTKAGTEAHHDSMPIGGSILDTGPEPKPESVAPAPSKVAPQAKPAAPPSPKAEPKPKPTATQKPIPAPKPQAETAPKVEEKPKPTVKPAANSGTKLEFDSMLIPDAPEPN
jgi:hypothetical protein